MAASQERPLKFLHSSLSLISKIMPLTREEDLGTDNFRSPNLQRPLADFCVLAEIPSLFEATTRRFPTSVLLNLFLEGLDLMSVSNGKCKILRGVLGVNCGIGLNFASDQLSCTPVIDCSLH